MKTCDNFCPSGETLFSKEKAQLNLTSFFLNLITIEKSFPICVVSIVLIMSFGKVSCRLSIRIFRSVRML